MQFASPPSTIYKAARSSLSKNLQPFTPLTLRSDILPHRDRLYRLALGITLHTAEAEDVVQETMIRAWEHREE